MIPEYYFYIDFQMTFACITPALIRRAHLRNVIRFPRIMLFDCACGLPLSYFPSATWYGMIATGCCSMAARLISPAEPSDINAGIGGLIGERSWLASGPGSGV